MKENSNPSNQQKSILGSAWFCLFLMLVALTLPLASHAQDTGYISGTVSDKSGAAIVGAEVVVTSVGGSLTRTTTSNADGAYVVAGLPGGTYNIKVTAKGFETYQAKGVKLDVAQKIRVDVQVTVGQITEQVVVEGTNVAQVETQSSDLGGTILGSQITQLQLNGRNFTQLATLVPGVTNEGTDEGKVGVTNIYFSFNGGRLEYNNWELDGGDNMDNGSNQTLNVYPSVDAIAEVKVLTSNYGAQYGRNSSGTVEVETKSGTNKFHGDVYYFGRNDFFNARNFFDPTADANGRPLGAPPFKKHDYGYTIGGPVFIPGHYNSSKQKTFFFFSEEWRRDLVPGQSFLQGVPSVPERGGNFSDVCSPTPGLIDPVNFPACPINPATSARFTNDTVTVDPNAQAILAEIPTPTSTAKPGAPTPCGTGIVACFNSSPAQASKWREELVRLDHNFTSNERLTFRYIHDSWSTVTATTLWACPDGCSFPTIQTNFVGPGTSTVARLTSTLTPTLLNEFVASYTADHIFLTNIGPGAVARSSVTPKMTMTGLFPFSDKLPGFKVTGNSSVYGGAFEDDQAYIPWNNANPTYTLRDNVTKVAGTHTLQFGAYAVIAQKNEQSSFGDTQGFLTFDATDSVVSTGNAFADLLLGRIAKFQQANRAPKYYFRYQIAEPYFQDDWRVTSHFTLNLGVRLSLFGTYREKYKTAFNFESNAFNPANAPNIDPSTGALVDPTTGTPLAITDPRVFNGIVQCGAAGQPAGCVQGHLFNPAPRIGFAWDPWGDGKTSVRGGYGMFFEHGNGNEQNVEVLEATAPFVLNPSQPNIIGYTNIGAGGANAFPLSFNAIGTRGVWPNVQQWNLNVQHELPQHIVASIAYAGSKGTHLGLRREFNQLQPLPLSQDPYKPGEAIGPNDCTPDANGNFFTPSGTPITGPALVNFAVACGGDPNPHRPFLGFGGINGVQYVANSNYNSLQVSVRRAVAPLILSLAYTYSHSIDNASTGGAGNPAALVNSYDAQRARASSDFDQRHTLNISYVYDLPSYWKTGLAHGLFGDWQFSGVTTIQTGTPFNVITTGISDNAGVGNGSGPGVFADLVGDPHGSFTGTAGPGPQLFNPNAFAAPRGLTFGNVGRNILHVPRRTNFDMSLLKHFKLNESTGIEFRAEAFNIFNHTQWGGSVLGPNGVGITNDITSGSFLHPSSAHRGRTLQFGLKFLF